ncbi:glycerophosphodiester phosphodiesterase [Microlunatus panaciterrae]|uniref:Glycerophosphoryl diester phosphodiesterase n=1 Tax=Microlunatus panaciterrae TaxID=400768 RepID=A0ABS2RH46_9ACTN|nr:glycerophosphodiester phosphodiesterase family protein [Microlunatus panaciterrae]MBM7798321.1 glycerophosphoryl diester phosphodiesterase [Microlunatus panaciterrae]
MIIFGHRGARFEAPENTVAGFAYAKRIGLRAVEFDVRMTSDDQLVVIHDATVDRTTDGTGPVAEQSLARLRELDARAVFPDWADPCGVPTLDEVLAEVGDLEQLEIEIKKDKAGRSEQIVQTVLDTLENHQVDAEVTITSFHVDSLRLVQRLAPEQQRGYVGEWDSDAFLDIARWLGASRAGMPHETGSAERARAAHELGLSVIGWPCNVAAEVELFRSWDADAVCSDCPSSIVELVAVG